MNTFSLRRLLLSFTCALIGSLAASSVSAQMRVEFDEDPAGIAVIGRGTADASMSLGTVSAFGGTVPAGVTRTTGLSSWSLSTPFRLRVQNEPPGSPSYTLRAQLASASGLTWKIDGITVVQATPSTITTAGIYGQREQHTFQLTIPYSAPEGAVSNTINVTIIAN